MGPQGPRTRGMMARGATIDTGGLLAVERRDLALRSILGESMEAGLPVHVPAGVLAQAWRGGPRQARLARFLRSREVTIVALDERAARLIGVRCAATGHDDVVDVHVAVHAREQNHLVVTSDPDDLHRIDPSLELVVV